MACVVVVEVAGWVETIWWCFVILLEVVDDEHHGDGSLAARSWLFIALFVVIIGMVSLLLMSLQMETTQMVLRCQSRKFSCLSTPLLPDSMVMSCLVTLKSLPEVGLLKYRVSRSYTLVSFFQQSRASRVKRCSEVQSVLRITAHVPGIERRAL